MALEQYFLTITALSTVVTVQNAGVGELEYSYNGSTFEVLQNLEVYKNEKIYLRSRTGQCVIKITNGQAAATGNILSVGEIGEKSHINLFIGSTGLVSARINLSTTTAPQCFSGMFVGCTNLVDAPDLSATTAADGCYNDMFSGCAKLEHTFYLPATTLGNAPYKGMLNGTGVKVIGYWGAPLNQSTPVNMAGIVDNPNIKEIHLSRPGMRITGDSRPNGNLIITYADAVRDMNVSGIVDSFGVERCRAGNYTRSYYSNSANNTYVAADTLNGGWNKIVTA